MSQIIELVKRTERMSLDFCNKTCTEQNIVMQVTIWRQFGVRSTVNALETQFHLQAALVK